MTAYEWVEVAELQSTQVEADTRLLLHAPYALRAAMTGSKAVIVPAEDTDVMLLCLAFQKDIPCHIYLKDGTQNRTRFVDISKLAWSLGNSVCDSLIWATRLYMMRHLERRRQSREAACHEAREKGHNLPGDV